MATTSIPAVKQALCDLFAGAAMTASHKVSVDVTLTGVQVAWGRPKDADMLDEMIVVGDVESEDDTTVSMRKDAQGKVEENYEVAVVVSVRKHGNDPRTVETRMWALVARVETLIRADPTLGGDVAGAGYAVVSSKTQTNYSDSEARVSDCAVAVAVKARI